MRFINILSSLTLATLASARIYGVGIPSEIQPGEDFNVTILTENYIQSVSDISAAFGLGERLYAGSLGSVFVGSAYLGPEKSNIVKNFTLTAKIPSTYPTGEVAYFNVAITSLYGTLSSPTSTIYNVPFVVGNATDDYMVWSTNGTNTCSLFVMFYVLQYAFSVESTMIQLNIALEYVQNKK
ncbi:Hypothetical protein R9X50_00126200 [Acrodontium crateriforme]|uniref:Uncharacterized protein n=1 Tax=Acrodontium crateriforme TaxID=150365 RepID=A0AAQ3M4U5_9PEZI|nr:Hypothetical protein R9X50_00126200 [Acrodontium crateriforme]